MGIRIMSRAHVATLRARARLADASGQGTVEYVALVLLVAGVMATVIAFASKAKGETIAATVVQKLKDAIEGVGKKG